MTNAHPPATHVLFEDEYGEFLWPRCAVHRCAYMASLRRKSIYCDPHTNDHEAGMTVLEMQPHVKPDPPHAD